MDTDVGICINIGIYRISVFLNTQRFGSVL